MYSLPACLTHVQALSVRQALQTLGVGAAESTVVLDASALQQFDSSALAVLLDCRRQLQAKGKTLALQHAPARLLELAKLYGVEELLLAASAGNEKIA